MKLHVLLEILKILRTEGLKVEEVESWYGWDEFQDVEQELEIRFDDWGETLQVRLLCLECGQNCHACSCRGMGMRLHPYP